eukprot:8110215-Karenia_brevis.AAC.1
MDGAAMHHLSTSMLVVRLISFSAAISAMDGAAMHHLSITMLVVKLISFSAAISALDGTAMHHLSSLMLVVRLISFNAAINGLISFSAATVRDGSAVHHQNSLMHLHKLGFKFPKPHKTAGGLAPRDGISFNAAISGFPEVAVEVDGPSLISEPACVPVGTAGDGHTSPVLFGS